MVEVIKRSRRAVLTVAVAAVLVGACSSSKSASTTTTTKAASTSTASTVPAPTTAAGIPRCGAPDLNITAGDSQGAAGTISAVFTMTNKSGHPCELNGYPGIGMQYQDGKLAPTTANRGGGMSMKSWPGPSRVVLQNGGNAYFVMDYSDVPTGNGTCAQFPGIVVTPPNGVATASVKYGASPCTVNGSYVVNVSAVSGSKH